ncbi:MAG: hypothetical protein K9G76_07600 [Bacteroidales bacterium]|nr:hypothetical protein [Bacteroidales bacterium]MCF8405443.1 hypothetical protein [Bacteroidales bacterium]
MKFKIIISILAIAMVALFGTVIYQTNKIKNINAQLQASEDSLRVKNMEIEAINEANIAYMKKINVYEKGDREKAERKQRRAQFDLGILIQSKDKDYQGVIAYTVGSGFNLEYIKNIRVNRSVIYYYSQDGKEIADEVVTDLSARFPNLSNVSVEFGISSEASNKITAYLLFTY